MAVRRNVRRVPRDVRGHADIGNAGRFSLATGGSVRPVKRLLFFDVYPRYRYEDIDVLDFRVCYNGEWYNTRYVPQQLIERIMQSPRVAGEQKTQLQKMVATKGELSFYDIFSLTRVDTAQ